MIESLRPFLVAGADITVFGLDTLAANASRGVADRVIPIEDVNDPQFKQTRSTRSHEEFCWSCAPILSHYMLSESEAGDLVIYLDADLFFFTAPNPLLAEMEPEHNIMIHPHRFSGKRLGWIKSAGIFNVGMIVFRSSVEANTCAARWREQVLHLCTKDPERGLCGDQGYLNEWPDRYSGLRIMENIGGGAAPWNIENYSIASTKDRPSVNGTPIVFYHFHQLRIVHLGRERFLGAICATGYRFSEAIMRAVYDPYLAKLKQKSVELEKSGILIVPDYAFRPIDVFRDINLGQIRCIALNARERAARPGWHILRAFRKMATRLGLWMPSAS